MLALALLLAWAPVATGQERPERAWSSPILQVGMADCGGATGRPEDKAGFLLTTDVSVLRHPGRRTTWGVGLRLAADDDGARAGAKGIVRRWLGAHPQRGLYAQVAPGISFAGTDNARGLRHPGFFLEAEVGLAGWLGLVADLEIIPYRDALMGWRDVVQPGGGWHIHEPVRDASGTEVSWHVGGRATGWAALGAGLALMAAVAIAMSSWDGLGL